MSDVYGAEPEYIGCTVMQLPETMRERAAKMRAAINPANRPILDGLFKLLEKTGLTQADIHPPDFLTLLTTNYWEPQGRKLGVSFMDNPPADLRDRIISHMNAWAAFTSMSFAWSQSHGEVRIGRGSGGYSSYLGPDILHVPTNQQTMNLQGFTMNTAESEYHRVVRHETGHTCGFPHEHTRPEIVALLDPMKTITYFGLTQGWSATVVRQQILNPLQPGSWKGTPEADQTSIMCYGFPGAVTKNGQAIPGGPDINGTDRAFAASVYPLAVAPPPPPPVLAQIVLTQNMPAGTYVLK